MGFLVGPEDPRRRGLTGEALAVAAAPIAYPSTADLVRLAEAGEAAVFCGLEALQVAGLVDHWETEAGLFVTFTPLGASEFGVRLIAAGPAELPRWAYPETPDPSPPKAQRIFRDHDALAAIVGPTPPPDLLAEDAEAEELAHGGRPDGLPDRRPGRPPRLVGAGLPWPGRRSGGPCLVCKGALRPDEFCLCCSTAGKKPVQERAKLKRSRSRAAKRFARSDSIAAVRRRRAC